MGVSCVFGGVDGGEGTGQLIFAYIHTHIHA